jgi:hypothetical protein
MSEQTRASHPKDAANEGVISRAASRVAVRVIHTDEELMIARTVCRVLGLGLASEKRIPAMRRNRFLGWIRFRRAVSAHSGDASAGAHEYWHPCRSR